MLIPFKHGRRMYRIDTSDWSIHWGLVRVTTLPNPHKRSVTPLVAAARVALKQRGLKVPSPKRPIQLRLIK